MTSPGEVPVADTDKPGILPRRFHLWVVLGLAGLLLGVTSLTRSGGTKAPTDAAIQQTEAEARGGEDVLLRRLKEQTQREIAAMEASGKAREAAAELEQAAAMKGAGEGAPVMPGLELGRPDSARTRMDNSGIGPDHAGGEWAGKGGNRASSMALSYRQAARSDNGRRGSGVGAEGAGAAELSVDELMRRFVPAGPQAGQEQQNSAVSAPGAAVTTGRNRAGGADHVLFEGSVLETVLLTRLNGDFSGPAVCMVTTDQLSHDGKSILVPAGSRVIGATKKVEAFGQVRMAVAFHRLIMPDGYSVDLRQFTGLNAQGDGALKDRVNNHYLQLFGASVAVGALGAMSPASLAGGGMTGRVGIVPSLGQEATQILEKFLNVLPSITIREGHRMRVFFTQDITLPAYSRHRMPRDL